MPVISTIISKLVKKQIKDRLTNKEMVEKLGNQSIYWWVLMKREPERLYIPAWISGLWNNFPDMREDLIKAISKNNDEKGNHNDR